MKDKVSPEALRVAGPLDKLVLLEKILNSPETWEKRGRIHRQSNSSAYEKEENVLNGHFGSHFKRIKQAIEEKTSFYSFYSASLMILNKKISISVRT